MVYRHQVLRLTAFGSAYGGDEEWSTGFYMGEVSDNVADPTQASADDFLAAFTTYFTAAASKIGASHKLEGVRVAKYDTSGDMFQDFNFYSYPTVAPTGGGGGTTQIPQITVVVSLQARPDRGLGSKGRMFLPGINEGIGADGRMTTASINALLTPFKTMLTACNNSTNLPGHVINASKGNGLFPSFTAVNRTVQDLLVGNMYDTQRRRRNQMKEVYVTQVLSA